MKLRYFCEHCGKEVPRNSRRCPHCGKFFSSVQCPRCGHQGEGRTFDAGCPACGYLRFPESNLQRFSVRGGAPSSFGSPGSRGLYRILGLVLALVLVGTMALLILRSLR